MKIKSNLYFQDFPYPFSFGNATDHRNKLGGLEYLFQIFPINMNYEKYVNNLIVEIKACLVCICSHYE